MLFDIWKKGIPKYQIECINAETARAIAAERYHENILDLQAISPSVDCHQTDLLNLANDIQGCLNRANNELLKARERDDKTEIEKLSLIQHFLDDAAQIAFKYTDHIDKEIRQASYDAFERRVWQPEEYRKRYQLIE